MSIEEAQTHIGIVETYGRKYVNEKYWLALELIRDMKKGQELSTLHSLTQKYCHMLQGFPPYKNIEDYKSFHVAIILPSKCNRNE